MQEGLARVGVPVQLLWGEAGDAGIQHGHVVPHEEDGQPLVQVPPHHAKLAISGPGELEGEEPDGLQCQLVPPAEVSMGRGT